MPTWPSNVARLREQEARVRSGETSGVHKMRITARRLRTTLRTCQPLFDASTDALSDELRWLGRVLSGARDAQVLRERLRHLVSTQPPELVMGPVDVLIDDELSAAEQLGRAHALEALEDTRYLRLRADLDALVRDLPMTEDGDRPARDVFPRLVRRDAKRLRRAVRAARQVEAGEAHDAALHDARKKAKRLRYAAELAVPALGKPARKLASSAKEVQQALGEHQDTVMSRRFLREHGRAHAPRGDERVHPRPVARDRGSPCRSGDRGLRARVGAREGPQDPEAQRRLGPDRAGRAVLVVPQARVELATFRLGGGCSIH